MGLTLAPTPKELLVCEERHFLLWEGHETKEISDDFNGIFKVALY